VTVNFQAIQRSRPLLVSEEHRVSLMADRRKHLVVGILQFLEDQRRNGGLSDDAVESLEVASQCLESAYGVDLLESATLQQFPIPADGLIAVFHAGIQAKNEEKRGPQSSVADKESADKLKVEGNEFMKKEMVAEAIECYSRAIDLDRNNAVYYCNRAAAYNKLSKFYKAVDDCNIAIEIDPQYSKAYNRRGVAQISLNKFREARDSFAKALELEPMNEGYKTSLEQAEHKLSESQRSGAGGGGGLNLGGLDFSSMLNNPALMNMATNMMSNPQIQQMMANMMMAGGGGAEAAGGMGNLLQAGQQLAQQMQESNPELVDQLRQQMGRSGNPPNPDDSSSS